MIDLEMTSFRLYIRFALVCLLTMLIGCTFSTECTPGDEALPTNGWEGGVENDRHAMDWEGESLVRLTVDFSPFSQYHPFSVEASAERGATLSSHRGGIFVLEPSKGYSDRLRELSNYAENFSGTVDLGEGATVMPSGFVGTVRIEVEGGGDVKRIVSPLGVSFSSESPTPTADIVAGRTVVMEFIYSLGIRRSEFGSTHSLPPKVF